MVLNSDFISLNYIISKVDIASSNLLVSEDEKKIIKDILNALPSKRGFISRKSAISAILEKGALTLNRGARRLIIQIIQKTPPAVITEFNPSLKPLSVDQLRRMKADPVWVSTDLNDCWMLAYENGCSNQELKLNYSTYGKSWVAYN